MFVGLICYGTFKLIRYAFAYGIYTTTTKSLLLGWVVSEGLPA